MKDAVLSHALIEGRMSDLQIEVNEAGGPKAYVKNALKLLSELSSYINFLDTQARKEINKGGAFDNSQELEDALKSTKDLYDRVYLDYKIVNNTYFTKTGEGMKENIEFINNVNDQDFDKEFVGTAPVSYADAVIKMREKRRKVAKEMEQQKEDAEKALGIKDEMKIVLDEGLFEEYSDEGKAECPVCKHTPCICNAPSHVVWVKSDGKWLVYMGLNKEKEDYSELIDDLKERGYEDIRVVPNGTNLYADNTEEVIIEENENSDNIYRVTYLRNDVYLGIMVKATSPEQAKEKIQKKYPDAKVVGAVEIGDDEVKEMKHRGMSLLEAIILQDLDDYEPWEGAVNTYERIKKAGKLEEFDNMIEEMYPDGIRVSELNDLLWFEDEWVYNMLDMPIEDEE